MRLSEVARRRLSDEFGADYIVLDLHEAPTTTDVLLTHPVSPQLLGMLRHQFPSARVLITEIEDEELGIILRVPSAACSMRARRRTYRPGRSLDSQPMCTPTSRRAACRGSNPATRHPKPSPYPRSSPERLLHLPAPGPRDRWAPGVETVRCRVAVVSAWSAGPVQSRVLGATSRTITQLPWPLGRS